MRLKKVGFIALLIVAMMSVLATSAFASTEVKQVTVSINAGGNYPQTSYYFSDGTFAGNIPLVSVSNNPYIVDQGYWVTETAGFSQIMQTINQVGPSQIYINQNGFSGYIPRTSVSVDYHRLPDGRLMAYYTSFYNGPLSKQVWRANLVTYNNYTGVYSGTVYKNA